MEKQFVCLVNQRLPIEKAYGLQIAKMCEAFVGCGAHVRLVTPTRRNHISQDFFDFYSIKRNFRIKKLFSPDFYFPGRLDKVAVAAKSFISALVLTAYAFLKKADFFYSRDELPLYFLSFFKKNLVFEAHRFSKKRSFFYQRFKNRGLKTVVISKGLREEFIKFGFKPENILVASDGVDLEKFDIKENSAECRKKLNLPQDKKIIGYIGQLKTMGMEKGIDALIESFKILETKYNNLILVVVGGVFGGDESEFKNYSYSDKVMFLGYKPYSLVSCYLKAFDVLIMPFPAREHYAFYMSPLKLFEYMASRRPIVATDLPTVREVLNEDNSVLVRPDDHRALAEGIKKVLTHPELAEKISGKAFEDVKNYTWHKRAEKILEFIQ